MDKTKVNTVNAADIAATPEKVDLSSTAQRKIDFPVLTEWEMALAGGGEGAVCW